MDCLLRYCLCWVLLVPSLTFAATKTIVVEPGDLVRTYSAGPMAFSDSRSWDIVADVPRGKARPTVPATVTRGFSWPSFRGGLKNALKISPSAIIGNAVIAGAVGAVGWLIDSSTGVLMKPAGEPVLADAADFSLSLSSTGCPGPYRTLDEYYTCAQSYMDSVDGRWNLRYINPLSSSSNIQYTHIREWKGGPIVEQSVNTASFVGTCASPFALTNGVCLDSSNVEKSPVLDADLDPIVNGITSPQDAADIGPDLANIPGSYDYDSFDLSGPSSFTGEPSSVTVTDPSTGTTTVTETTPTYNYEYSTDPLSITTTYNEIKNTYQNGVLIQSETTNNTTTPTETQSEVPTDCDFMPTVCAWLEWFKEPAPMPEISWQPIEELPAYSPSIGSGSGSCPAPITVNTAFVSGIEISYQPFCDFAAILKIFVVGGALLFAIYINMGISRSTN